VRVLDDVGSTALRMEMGTLLASGWPARPTSGASGAAGAMSCNATPPPLCRQVAQRHTNTMCSRIAYRKDMLHIQCSVDAPQGGGQVAGWPAPLGALPCDTSLPVTAVRGGPEAQVGVGQREKE